MTNHDLTFRSPEAWESYGLDIGEIIPINGLKIQVSERWFHLPYITLWWTNIAIENGHRNSGFSH